MAVELATLADRLSASVNVPGQEFIVAEEDDWVSQLANAFWWARLRGFFTGYRVNDDFAIVPVDPADDDVDEGLTQVVVAFAAVLTLENMLLSLPTGERYKAGPVETETNRSAQVLVQLLKARRFELEDIKDDLTGANNTNVHVIDTFISRTAMILEGAGYGAGWIN